MPNTVRLHRVIAAKPEKLYRAFVEADAIASWLPPFGFLCTVHELDAKVGGRHRMSFRNFTTGGSHSFGGEYLELVPGERLVYTDRFDDPNLPGEMTITVRLKAVSCGTELSIEQAGTPEMTRSKPAISAGRNRCASWRSSSSPKSTNRGRHAGAERAAGAANSLTMLTRHVHYETFCRSSGQSPGLGRAVTELRLWFGWRSC